MSITYNQATINARLNAVVTNIDAGPSFGQMRLLTAGSATVALIALLKPSGTVSGGVLTFSGLPLNSATTVTGGTVAAADIEDSTGTVVASGLTVGNSTAFDVAMGTTSVSSGQIITLTAATITGR
jgi:hypothetical protein